MIGQTISHYKIIDEMPNKKNWIFMFAFFAATFTLFAQVETAQIAVTVTDNTGAVVPGVEITMIHVGTNRQVVAITNEEGSYASVPLPIGEYRVEASLPGFKRAVRTGIILEVQERAVVDLTLEIGEVTIRVQVMADAPLLNTSEASQGQVIDERRVVDMPLNGRDYIQLALLSVGAIQPVGGRAGGFSAGGQRTTQNNYLLDGIDNNSVESATAGRQAEMVKPSIDAIQEFKVQTNVYSAEFGHSMGAVVNVTTKSGTNAFHGTIFEFLRNEKLDAKNFFDPPDQPKPPFKRNQFGFSIGGPIVKDKTFVFGAWERTRSRESATTVSTIPTLKMRQGDFSELGGTIFDPATFDPSTQTRQPFPDNIIPENRFDPLARALIDVYPNPQNNQLANNFVLTSPDTQDIDRWTIRIDHIFSSSDSVYYRLSRQKVTFPAILRLPLPAFGGGGVFDGLTRHWNTGLVWNHVFSPTFLTSNRVGWNLTRFARLNPAVAGEENLNARFGIKGVDQNIPGGFSTFNLSGFRNIGLSAFNGVDRDSQNRQYANDTNWIRGHHTVKFGFNLLRMQNNVFNVRQDNGIFRFNGRFTNNPATGAGGNAVADFLLGITDRFDRSTTIDINLRSWLIGTYLQDDWKVTPKLTLNLGLRYELVLPRLDRRDRMAQFDIDSDPFNARLISAGPGGTRINRSLVATDTDNFGPRIGFAYQLLPKFVIRGGYGIFYEVLEPSGDADFLVGNPPFAYGAEISTDGINPQVILSEGAPDDLLTPEKATNLTFSSFELFPSRGYAQQWNLNIQYELAQDLLFEIGYFATKGTHLLKSFDGNPSPPGPGNIDEKRRFKSVAIPGTDVVVSPLARVIRHEWTGNSNFHSLQTKVEKRFSTGFTLLSSYMFSRTIGDSCGFAGSGNASGCGIQDPTNLRFERSLDNQHIKHRFVGSYIVELPFGQGRRWGSNWSGTANALLGGWRVAGIVTLTSGPPFNVVVQGDPANTGTSNRPDLVGDLERPEGVDKIDQFFNTQALARNKPFTFGNAGRNLLTGPSFNNFDFSVLKDFTVTEDVRVQFRFEAFNFFNTPHFRTPGNVLGTSTFGRITVAGRSRNLQFGLKIIF